MNAMPAASADVDPGRISWSGAFGVTYDGLSDPIANATPTCGAGNPDDWSFCRTLRLSRLRDFGEWVCCTGPHRKRRGPQRMEACGGMPGGLRGM